MTYTRTIKPGHYLRPIPQGQLDGMEMSADEKRTTKILNTDNCLLG